MKFIPRFFHGVLDYLTSLVLMIAPNVFGFAEAGGPAVWVPRIVGLMILLQAMITEYELGLIKMIPINMHLMTDYVAAAFLVFAPWLFGFGQHVTPTITLVVAGGLVGGVTLLTEPRGRPRIMA